MRTRTILTVAALVLSTAAIGAGPRVTQDAVQLSHKVKVGDSSRFQTDGKAAISMGGQQMSLVVKAVEKYTATAIAANGDITLTDVTESVEMSMEGNPMPPDPSALSTDTLVIKPNGMLVSYQKGNGTGQDEEARMHNATSVIFADTPVKVGDKWSRTFQANDAAGIHAARGNYEVLAFESVGGVACVKIGMTYQETEQGGVSTKGTFWVERATGDSVKVTGTVENFPIDPASGAIATLTITQTRLPK